MKVPAWEGGAESSTEVAVEVGVHAFATAEIEDFAVERGARVVEETDLRHHGHLQVVAHAARGGAVHAAEQKRLDRLRGRGNGETTWKAFAAVKYG